MAYTIRYKCPDCGTYEREHVFTLRCCPECGRTFGAGRRPVKEVGQWKYKTVKKGMFFTKRESIWEPKNG